MMVVMIMTVEEIATIVAKPIVMIIIMAMIIVPETSICQEIVDHRRSRAGIDIGREKMI